MNTYQESGTKGNLEPQAWLVPALNKQAYSEPAGDFFGREHGINVKILNNSVSLRLNSASPEVAGETPVEKEANRLTGDIYAYRQAVQEYFPTEIHAAIAQRYTRADLDTVGLGMDERVRARLASAPEGLSISSDLDGTITKDPNSYLISHIPGSAIAEPLLEERGRASFATVFAETWQPLLQDAPEHFFEGGKQVAIREGVGDTFKYLNEINADVAIVSANFKPFVDGVLSNIPYTEDLKVIAVTPESIVSTDKGTVVKHLAQEKPDRAHVFIGDGSSDLPAIEASDVIACFFALEDTAFAMQLANRNLPHFTYRTFDDIRLKLEGLYVPPVVNQALPS